MEIEGVLNNIEKSSLREGYLDKYLPHYLDLRKAVEGQLERVRQAEEARADAFFSAVNRFIYMVFENLRFLHLQLRQDPAVTGNSFNIYQHLPTFMATLVMAFPISEYLRRVICLLGLHEFEIEKNAFTSIISRTKRDVEFKEVTEFLQQAEGYRGCAGIDSLWHEFSKANDLRHTYTHGFRLPWWPREGAKVYGFPKTITSDSNKIKDEIWEFVTDSNAWQKKVSKLDDSKFISGADLLEEVHDQGTRLADMLFLSFIEHIKIRAI